MREYFEKIYKRSQGEFYNLIKDNLINNQKTFVITANPETIMLAEENDILKSAFLDEETIVVPDGIGIVKGAKMLGYKKPDKTITGIALVEELFRYCNDYKKSLFLFGAKKSVLDALVKKIQKDYPDICISGSIDGYVENKQEAFATIKEKNPDVVLVALGVPNQEIIIYQNLKDFDKGIFVGVGGSFDVLSGMKKRAPKIFLKYNLEWLYRITREPKRLKRFLKSNVKYISKIKDEKKNKTSKDE